MPKLPRKKTKVLAEKQAFGQKLGELKALLHFKRMKEGMELSLREHLGKMIDRIDVVETTAILGLTYLIHETIATDTELTNLMNKALALQPVALYKYFFETIGEYLRIPTIVKQPEQDAQKEILNWILCFTMAFLLIRHAGPLMGLLGGGLKSVVKLLLPGG